MNNNKRILFLEDNENDVLLAKLALKSIDSQHELHTVSSINAALELLQNLPIRKQAPPVDFIILDLTLVNDNGAVFLNTLKSDPKLKIIPVVIFTTSSSDKDVYESYAAHANLYIKKPMLYDTYVRVFQFLNEMWDLACSPVYHTTLAMSEKKMGGIQGEAFPF